jgi:hypothetical protein
MRQDFSRFRGALIAALIIGVSFGILTVILGFTGDAKGFFQSYLYAFLFWLGMGLGCLALLMLQYIAGGGWGAMTRRPLEAAGMTMPLLALLFIPVCFGIPELYSWSHADVVAASSLLQHKQSYLNVPFFIIRAAIYFGIWILFAVIFFRLSKKQDRGGKVDLHTMRAWAAPGLILYMVTMTFAAIDWAMSLKPLWYSDLYGSIWIVTQAVSAVTLIILAVAAIAHFEPVKRVFTTKRWNDLGNLLLAFSTFWAYISFIQLLMIWSHNIIPTNTWYVLRMHGEWRGLLWFLIAFHFAVPLLVLLSRWMKYNIAALVVITVWMVLMRLVDLFWVVIPAYGRSGFPLHLLDVFAVLGMGGFWVAFFIWQLSRQPLVPVNDVRLEPSPETLGTGGEVVR